MIWTMFEPTNPPVAPTPEAFLESWLATDSEMLFCVPAFVEAWATNPDSVDKLKTLRLIVCMISDTAWLIIVTNILADLRGSSYEQANRRSAHR